VIYSILLIFVTVIFVVLYLRLKSQRDHWQKRAEKYKRAYNDITGEFNAMFASNFHSFVEKFYEGTEIQNHSIQVSKDKIDVKIGDEEIMVKVDSEMLVKDVIGALEQAQVDWRKVKYGK
jgi:hypothetical protein